MMFRISRRHIPYVLGLMIITLGSPPRAYSQTLTTSMKIVDWLECLECSDLELQKVVAMGDSVVPILSDILHTGPTSVRKRKLERALTREYKSLKLDTHDKMTLGEYIRISTSNLDRSYKLRSAQALKEIGSKSALTAIANSLRKEQDYELRWQLYLVLDQKKNLPR